MRCDSSASDCVEKADRIAYLDVHIVLNVSVGLFLFVDRIVQEVVERFSILRVSVQPGQATRGLRKKRGRNGGSARILSV